MVLQCSGVARGGQSTGYGVTNLRFTLVTQYGTGSEREGPFTWHVTVNSVLKPLWLCHWYSGAL